MPAQSSVVIVTFNSASHIEECLRSLPAGGWERIVVDNASDDATAERAGRLKGIRVLANSENRGFAAAANQGARAVPSEWLLFLNPDITAEAGALERLRRAVEEAGVAAGGGLLLNPDGSPQVGFTVRRLPTLATALAELLLLNRLLPRNPWNRSYRCLDLNYDQPALIEQPPGACLLVKRSVWEELGGFDESFFPLWFEDVDFCRRLRACGQRILYEPQARFRHVGAHSLARLPATRRQFYWYRNLLRYFHKHHGPLAVAVLRVGIGLGMLLRLAALALGVQPQAGRRRDAAAAYAQVLRSCVLSVQ